MIVLSLNKDMAQYWGCLRGKKGTKPVFLTSSAFGTSMSGVRAGVQELQEFRSSGVQEFRGSGVQGVFGATGHESMARVNPGLNGVNITTVWDGSPSRRDMRIQPRVSTPGNRPP
jgi:hypothetical protein